MGILLWIEFDPLAVDYQYQIMFFSRYIIYISFRYWWYIFIFLVLLTLFLLPICILASWTSVTFYIKNFIYYFYCNIFIIKCFCVLDLLIFYMFYESILIPMFLIIGIWGSRTRKIHAAYQFFIYVIWVSNYVISYNLFVYYSGNIIFLN